MTCLRNISLPCRVRYGKLESISTRYRCKGCALLIKFLNLTFLAEGKGDGKGEGHDLHAISIRKIPKVFCPDDGDCYSVAIIEAVLWEQSIRIDKSFCCRAAKTELGR